MGLSYNNFRVKWSKTLKELCALVSFSTIHFSYTFQSRHFFLEIGHGNVEWLLPHLHLDHLENLGLQSKSKSRTLTLTVYSISLRFFIVTRHPA